MDPPNSSLARVLQSLLFIKPQVPSLSSERIHIVLQTLECRFFGDKLWESSGSGIMAKNTLHQNWNSIPHKYSDFIALNLLHYMYNFCIFSSISVK